MQTSGVSQHGGLGQYNFGGPFGETYQLPPQNSLHLEAVVKLLRLLKQAVQKL
jgi:hypothetical protein